MGNHLNDRQWLGILRQLVALGMIRVDLENHSVLRLGPRDRLMPVLREEASVSLRREAERSARKPKAERKVAIPYEISTPEDRALFEALRAERLKIAQVQNLPAYIVFNDATLVEFVRHRPRSEAEFAEMSGVGKSKLERYGRTFLEVIATKG